MSMIFPGMDPVFWKFPLFWPDVHASFIVYLREHLRPSSGHATWLLSNRVSSSKDLTLITRSSPTRGCGRLAQSCLVTVARCWRPTRPSKSKSHH